MPCDKLFLWSIHIVDTFLILDWSVSGGKMVYSTLAIEWHAPFADHTTFCEAHSEQRKKEERKEKARQEKMHQRDVTTWYRIERILVPFRTISVASSFRSALNHELATFGMSEIMTPIRHHRGEGPWFSASPLQCKHVVSSLFLMPFQCCTSSYGH